MKNFTKILSMVLLVAMCMSMLTVSAFADEHVCGNDTLVYHEEVPATCFDNGSLAYYSCSGCSVLRFPGGEVINTMDQLTIPAAHSNVTVPAVAATCVTAGNLEYVICTVCGVCNNSDITDTSVFTVPAGSADHVWGEYEITKQPTESAEGEKRATCTVIGCTAISDPVPVAKLEPAVIELTVAQVNGGASYTYKGASDYYNYIANKAVDKVTANGVEIDFSVSTKNEVFIKGSQIADMESTQINLVFFSGSEAFSGLFISKPDLLVVEELEVSGLTQNKYVKESGKNVSFQTSDANAENVKLFSLTTQTNVASIGNTFSTAYYDTYTYTFTNSFLDSLDCGNYEIRCYYGTKNSEYKTPGTLMISDPNTNVDDSLYFVNSTQGDSEYFKYVSGDEVPRMYCPLFLVDGARLQVSTNGGKSWSNVNVLNYMIETKNSKDTAHAWIGSDYLDSLSADTIYYFRVVVPASANGTGSDWVSNTVSITTGPTLKAVDTAKHVINSTKNLKFVASEKIAKVYVGNVQLTDENDFNISNDGKTVTLSPSFLNKRTAGSTYTIKVLTTKGEYASTTFQILTTAQASASPRTGDTSNIGLWTAVLMLSAGAGVAILPRLKKEQ